MVASLESALLGTTRHESLTTATWALILVHVALPVWFARATTAR